jgi:hypothetical protein
VETRTAGSASGLEKRTSGNTDTALQADSTYPTSREGTRRWTLADGCSQVRRTWLWDEEVAWPLHARRSSQPRGIAVSLRQAEFANALANSHVG